MTSLGEAYVSGRLWQPVVCELVRCEEVWRHIARLDNLLVSNQLHSKILELDLSGRQGRLLRRLHAVPSTYACTMFVDCVDFFTRC